MNAHSHGLNNHTHSFTPSGTISSHSHSFLPTGTVTSSFSGTTHSFYSPRADSSQSTGTLGGQNVYRNWNSSYPRISEYAARDNDPSILLEWTDSGTVSSSFSGDKKDTDSVSPIFTGTKGTTGGNSENTTSETSTGSFTGTNGTTDKNGNGTSFSIMPPYVVKYCWERTA